MSFNRDCMQELLDNKDELSFAKYIIPEDKPPFVNTNIVRVYPSAFTYFIFDFIVPRDLQVYLNKLPDVSDETFISNRVKTLDEATRNRIKSLNTREYPPGGDSKYSEPWEIKMFHANCIVGLQNKINYMRQNGVWFL
jgi:hypothetical protein